MKILVAMTRLSPISGHEHTMTMMIDPEDYKRFLHGTLIQEALPYLSPSEREFLMTGITPNEWDDMFKEEEDGNGY